MHVKPWHRVTRDEFFDIARLRSEVFFIEQRIDVPDLDAADRDPGTLHWWLSDASGCAAYLRSVALDPPELGAARSFGRVAVRADRRGEGLARELVAAVVERYGREPMVIHSQSQVTRLYEEYGFTAVGEEFLEAGIPHRTMRRPGDVRVSAVVLADADGRVLLVRKHGTSGWMNPGGKPEPGESPAQCAAREVWEELGIRIDPDSLTPLGRLHAAAANEADTVVMADVFQTPEPLAEVPRPRAEIAQLRFVDPGAPEPGWAPLFTERIRPLLSRPGG